MYIYFALYLLYVCMYIHRHNFQAIYELPIIFSATAERVCCGSSLLIFFFNLFIYLSNYFVSPYVTFKISVWITMQRSALRRHVNFVYCNLTMLSPCLSVYCQYILASVAAVVHFPSAFLIDAKLWWLLHFEGCWLSKLHAWKSAWLK